MLVRRNLLVSSSKFMVSYTRTISIGKHFTKGSLSELQLKEKVPLAGRKYLPGSNIPGFPQYLSGPREDQPCLLKANNGQNASPEVWAKRCREVINEAYERYKSDLSKPVALLFRGLPIKTNADFSRWEKNLGYKPHSYLGGTGTRDVIEGNVYGGSVDDKRFSIEPHNEMTYSASYPQAMAFALLKKARKGGETAIADAREIERKLDRKYVKKLDKEGIKYLHFLSGKEDKYRSWQNQFMTDDPNKVEKYLDENGFSYEWKDKLIYWHTAPAYTTHPLSNEKLWFNQVISSHSTYFVGSPHFENIEYAVGNYPYHSAYGNGGEFEDDFIKQHRCATWSTAVGFEWQEGDVLFMDQLIMQHSRMGYEGDRHISIAMFTY